jgi:hypothetical protein
MNPVVKLNLTLNQVETKEAQEAHLLDFYISALQQLEKNNKAEANTNLLEITTSICSSHEQIHMKVTFKKPRMTFLRLPRLTKQT